jgi:predicted site-specific integrase-resolvase
MRIFYARSSTADQKSGLAGQIERAKKEGIEDDHIFAELQSGANTTNRPKLKECLFKGQSPERLGARRAIETL